MQKEINSYRGRDAAAYALAHGLDPNPSYRYFKVHGDGGGDCSNFISQCLHAGGAPMVHGSPRPWWYDSKGTSDASDDTWSVSWAVAHSLYWCLKARGTMGILGLMGIEVTDLSLLGLGDLIQYENHKGIIYHSAIITGFTIRREPLITQHSYDLINTSYIKPAARRMHFMKIRVQ